MAKTITADSKGTGLNSIPVRFALMSGIMTLLAAGTLLWALHQQIRQAIPLSSMLIVAGVMTLPPLITYLAANKLAGMIRALRESTQALVTGDFMRPVDIDCACEVGGLADSFRAMVARLNSNILRMNVLAYTDAITGLPNRTVIGHILSLAKRTGAAECAGSMLFIDLDGFKRVNDTVGHDAGDELLRQVADRIIGRGLGLSREELDTCTTAFGALCESCPSRPVFARFAGDEFVALLPGRHDHEELADIAGRIVDALAEPFTVYDNEVNIGASIGIARAPQDTDDPEQLLVYSDIAMYMAKEKGKNTYAFFDSALKRRAEERTVIERELYSAIANDELTLHFQPKLDVRSYDFVGVEALARWECPGLGAMSPDAFITIAENCGLMAPLGDAILRQAVRQAREWVDRGTPRRIAVNVSPVQFERPGLVGNVLATIDEFALEPSLLELEITETIAMTDFAKTRRLIDELREAGVLISIDDFGTGYSNLSQLSRLSFDALKIDRSLTSGIGENGKSEAMLTAIIGMAHALGYKVVAEGIEKPRQMTFLTRLGCDQMQGFLLARPMPASDIDAWIEQRPKTAVRALQRGLAL